MVITLFYSLMVNLSNFYKIFRLSIFAWHVRMSAILSLFSLSWTIIKKHDWSIIELSQTCFIYVCRNLSLLLQRSLIYIGCHSFCSTTSASYVFVLILLVFQLSLHVVNWESCKKFMALQRLPALSDIKDHIYLCNFYLSWVKLE